jgi:hypothetical protein
VNEDRVPKKVANFTPGSGVFQSKNEMNRWIEWNFKASQIEPTHYSIRTHGGEAGGAYLRHFCLSFEGKAR